MTGLPRVASCSSGYHVWVNFLVGSESMHNPVLIHLGHGFSMKVRVMFFRKPYLALVLAALLGTSMLAGCSDNNGGSSAGTPTREEILSELPEPNLELWTLPSESYDPPSPFLMDYARDVLATSCWKEHGLDIPIRRYNPQAPHPVTRSESNYPLLSVKSAQKFGYQLDLDPRVDWESRRKLWDVMGALSDEQFAAFEECATAADKELGFDQAISWGLSSPEDIVLTDEMKTASQQWRECMSPLGIADLSGDATPVMMPTAGAELLFGRGGTQDVPSWEQIEPSDEEVKIAVHDAECQEAANWRELFYQATWDYEVQIIIDNYQYVSASRIANETWEEQLNDVLASAK